MPPLRRYLRITRSCVLETVVYLDDPALADTWLLGGARPALPRIVDAIRQPVRARLRDENEWAGRAGVARKSRKQAEPILEDDFEVTIFFTESPTRHSLLRRQRRLVARPRARITSNSTRLTGADGGLQRAGSVGSVDSAATANGEEEEEEEKPVFETSYNGFSVHGRAVTLLVKRVDEAERAARAAGGTGKGRRSGRRKEKGSGGADGDAGTGAGMGALENWISTQSTRRAEPAQEQDDGD